MKAARITPQEATDTSAQTRRAEVTCLRWPEDFATVKAKAPEAFSLEGL